MYIAVTPLIHSIRGKDIFTYQTISPTETVAVGQVVWIPWRNQTVLGVVRQIKAVTPLTKAKPITAATPITLPTAYQAYIAWFAEFYAVSLSHAYYLALPQFTPRTLTKLLAQELTFTTNTLHSSARHAATYLIQNDLHVATYIDNIFKTASGPVVVVVPEIEQLKRLAVTLKLLSPKCVSSETSQPGLRAVFLQLLQAKPGLYLGTKRLSLFPLPKAQHVIMVEPEDFSHKQWGVNPRYHVYRLATYLQEHGVSVTYLSYCPRVEQYAAHPIITELRQQPVNSNVNTIAMQQQHRLSLQVQDRLTEANVVVVWHQHKGKSDLLVCQNCSTIISDTAALRCSTCQSPALRIRGFGTTDLAQQLRELYPDRPVLEITKDQLRPMIDYSARPILVGTSSLKNAIDWSKVDYTVVVSIDYLLGLAHFRAHEIVLQQLTWLKYHSPRLDIQTYVPDHPIFTALSQSWPKNWFEQTLRERQQLHFPPASERIELRHVKTQQRKVIRNLNELPDDPHWIIDREV